MNREGIFTVNIYFNYFVVSIFIPIQKNTSNCIKTCHNSIQLAICVNRISIHIGSTGIFHKAFAIVCQHRFAPFIIKLDLAYKLILCSISFLFIVISMQRAFVCMRNEYIIINKNKT